MANYVVKNIDNVIDSSNEAITIHSVNRNFEKLLENDIALAGLAEELNKTGSGIQGYITGVPYDKGEMIWFVDYEDGTPQLHILKSLLDENKNIPAKTLKNKLYTYEPSGWKDMYEYGTMIDGDLSAYVLNMFNLNL